MSTPIHPITVRPARAASLWATALRAAGFSIFTEPHPLYKGLVILCLEGKSHSFAAELGDRILRLEQKLRKARNEEEGLRILAAL